MTAIGGFFETERDLTGVGGCHPDALALSSGRAAFRAILESTKPRHVWVPCYTCDALLEPLRHLRIPFTFWALDSSLNPTEEFNFREGDYAVVVNYFGLKSEAIAALSQKWGNRLIIDNTQAFFEGPIERCFSFNSARKFFGVPDGGFLYSPTKLTLELSENKNITLDHLTKRAEGDLENAYRAFQAAEAAVTSEVQGMSRYSTDTLQRIPHGAVREKRRQNFAQYERAFAGINGFSATMAANAVPFCYPLLPERTIDRKPLYQQGIFPPTFWPEVIERTSNGFEVERRLAQDLLPLPVDHRYGASEIETVIKAVTQLVNASSTRN
jgi:hypothetical protein